MEQNGENLKTGKKRITIGDVANDLRLSKTTISRVISGKGRIGRETKERVMAYIQQIEYKPNVIAKGLAQSKTYNIGIAFPVDYNLVDLPFFQSCLMGVCNMASSLDYDVLITIVAENDISQLTRVISNHKVDGVVLTRTLVDDMAVAYLKQEKVPFAVIGATSDDHIIQVDNNHREACKELTSLLLMKGLKRVALIGGNMAHVVTHSRYDGYADAFAAHHLQVNRDYVYMGANNSVIVEKVVGELVEKQAECIICMDDLICSHVISKLEHDGVRIPQDIKVASFYSSALLENHTPSITSLKFNAVQLGMIACKTLLEYLGGKKVPLQILLPYEVVLKESTKI